MLYHACVSHSMRLLALSCTKKQHSFQVMEEQTLLFQHQQHSNHPFSKTKLCLYHIRFIIILNDTNYNYTEKYAVLAIRSHMPNQRKFSKYLHMYSKDVACTFWGIFDKCRILHRHNYSISMTCRFTDAYSSS